MSNRTELEYQRQVSQEVSQRECGSCEYFALHEDTPQCLFTSTEFTDCRLVVIGLNTPC